MIDLETLPKNVTHHIKKFQLFLISSYPIIDDIMSEHDWENDGYFFLDWIQVNWEFLVERQLLGKNYYLTSVIGIIESRVTLKEKKPEYAIFVIPKKEKLYDITNQEISNNQKLRFFALLGYGNNKQGLGHFPPFNVVDVVNDKTKQIIRVNFEDVFFMLDKYESTNRNN